MASSQIENEGETGTHSYVQNATNLLSESDCLSLLNCSSHVLFEIESTKIHVYFVSIIFFSGPCSQPVIVGSLFFLHLHILFSIIFPTNLLVHFCLFAKGNIISNIHSFQTSISYCLVILKKTTLVVPPHANCKCKEPKYCRGSTSIYIIYVFVFQLSV